MTRGVARTTAPVRSRALPVDLEARRILGVTQGLFFLAVLWCLVVYHGHNAQTDGISYYGVYPPTIAILVGGYGAAGVGLWWTSLRLRREDALAGAALGLRLIAVGLGLLLVTPYDRGPVWNWSHMAIGVSVALIQLLVSVRLLRELPSGGVVAGFSIQLLGGVLAALSLPDWKFDFLLLGQIVYQVGFAWCMLEWAHLLGARATASA